jgi:aerobic carbon-monoxide dehydrogenase small subunit
VSDRQTVTLQVDGGAYELELESRTLLSDALRLLGKRGVHVGCEEGACGACTVLLDGDPIRSCLTFAVQVDGRGVTTVHGLDDGEREAQLALHEAGAVQCGFCTAGILVTLAAARRNDALPATDADARALLSGHLCRCTGYQRLVDAVVSLGARR